MLVSTERAVMHNARECYGEGVRHFQLWLVIQLTTETSAFAVKRRKSQEILKNSQGENYARCTIEQWR